MVWTWWRSAEIWIWFWIESAVATTRSTRPAISWPTWKWRRTSSSFPMMRKAATPIPPWSPTWSRRRWAPVCWSPKPKRASGTRRWLATRKPKIQRTVSVISIRLNGFPSQWVHFSISLLLNEFSDDKLRTNNFVHGCKQCADRYCWLPHRQVA